MRAMPDDDARSRSRARKLPTQARARETVAAIVEAAARILEERGHAGFSTNAVAERAGVGIGSLYQYFPRKDALIAALLERETSLLCHEAGLALRRQDAVAALRDVIEACVAHQFRRPGLARLLDFEEARLPLDEVTRRASDAFEEIVVATLALPGVPRQADRRTAARDVVAIVKGIVDAAGMRGESDARAVATRVARAVFGYLGGD